MAYCNLRMVQQWSQRLFSLICISNKPIVNSRYLTRYYISPILKDIYNFILGKIYTFQPHMKYPYILKNTISNYKLTYAIPNRHTKQSIDLIVYWKQTNQVYFLARNRLLLFTDKERRNEIEDQLQTKISVLVYREYLSQYNRGSKTRNIYILGNRIVSSYEYNTY